MEKIELTATQISELAGAGSPHSLEIVAWISQSLVLVALVIAAIYAKQQVDHMREDSEQNLKIAQARLMLELDNRWDSQVCRKRVVCLPRHNRTLENLLRRSFQ